MTVREKVVVWTADVPVAVTVMGYVPAGVEVEVVMVMVDPEPPEVTDWGLNDTRAPAGAPLADRATSWGVPIAEVPMVLAAAAPAVTVWDRVWRRW